MFLREAMRYGGVEIKRMRLRFSGRGLFKRWMREREKGRCWQNDSDSADLES